MYFVNVSFDTAAPAVSSGFKAQHDSGSFSLNDSYRSKSWRVLVESVHCTGLTVVLTKYSCAEQNNDTTRPCVHLVPNYTPGSKRFQESEKVSFNWAVALSCSLYEAEFDIDLLQEIHLTSNYNKVLQRSVRQETADDAHSEDTSVNQVLTVSVPGPYSTPSRGNDSCRLPVLEQSPVSHKAMDSVGMQLDFDDSEHSHQDSEHTQLLNGSGSGGALHQRETDTSRQPLAAELSERSSLLSNQYISAAQIIRNTGNIS
jgi:hypothetical protein